MTPAEIAKALRCTATVQTGDEPCESCPFCRVEMMTEEQKAQLHCEGMQGWRGCDVDGVALAAANLIERLEKEKAALMEYAKKSAGCEQCANYRPRCECEAEYRDILCTENCPCQTCKRGSKWEWRGVDAE